MRWLRIKNGAKRSELWTIYQKSIGGRKGDKTEPRRLLPLLVRDLDGSSIDWKLQARIQIGEELPPLQSDGDGAQALNNYLRRREVRRSLKAEALNTGEQLTTYSFRNRYAKALHAANLPVTNIPLPMALKKRRSAGPTSVGKRFPIEPTSKPVSDLRHVELLAQ